VATATAALATLEGIDRLKSVKRLCLWLIPPLVLAVLATCLWMAIPYPVQSEAIDKALRSDDTVRVSRGEYLVFTPVQIAPERGLIFYPGGKTRPATFAPLLRQLAESGLLVVAVPMPLNTAFLGIDSANGVMKNSPRMRHRLLAGHSLRGVAAAMYAAENAQRLQGLILWAAYPPADMRALPLAVLSVYAADDLNTTERDIEQHMAWLPAGAQYERIEGNHWQFGHFSDGMNTPRPPVSREQQQAQILSATLGFARR